MQRYRPTSGDKDDMNEAQRKAKQLTYENIIAFTGEDFPYPLEKKRKSDSSGAREISDGTKKIIMSLLQPIPEIRLSAKDLLSHDWIKDSDNLQ